MIAGTTTFQAAPKTIQGLAIRTMQRQTQSRIDRKTVLGCECNDSDRQNEIRP